MLRFTWTYDHARGGAAVSVTAPDGEVTELGLVNNGNLAQILCDALAGGVGRGGHGGAALSWLGYVNPPRPAVVAVQA